MEKILFVLFGTLLILHRYSMPCFAITSLATDETSLLALKSHLNSSSDVFAHNWSTDISCCNWTGITCDPRQQRVTALNLSYMGITGTIPPLIGKLTAIQQLYLYNNNFSGSIPKEIGNLTMLSELYLGNNELSGIIPKEIGNLNILTRLYLGFNKLSGGIPKEIGNLTLLTRLYLNNNELSGSIPKEIGNLTMLTELDLTNIKVDGSIPREMGNLASLNFLSLAQNKLSGGIPKVIGNLAMLTRFYLDKNQLSGFIPKEIANITTLLDLHLGYNKLNGTIPQEMGNLASLDNFSLENNHLTGHIPPAIFNMSSTRAIDLHNNSLSGTLPKFLHDHLTKLVLSDNQLSGSIPPMIFNISTLEIIALDYNNLSSELPPSFGVGLVNLKGLYLAENKLSGTIPSSISNASMLSILDLSFNSFTGSIPHSLGTLQLLTYLYLEYNSLTIDTFSQELSFLTSLTSCRNLMHLQLSFNNFDGTLPNCVGNFSTSLEDFGLTNCNIKGHIPREIGNLSNLIELSLDNNTLSGSIPVSVGKLQKLQYLGFGNNSLEGHIPYDLCLLKNLAYLYLFGNELSGPIPTCISNLTSLLELRLNFNKLTSTIPFTLGSITSILILNLSSNLLSGNLPMEIGGLKALTQVDISDNQLSGSIPPVIGYLQSLYYLSLAHNKLQGLIPSSFEHLISLEHLDLSVNNLSGAIPILLEKLKYFKFFNVSSNRLHGEIPNGGAFINFSAKSFMLNDELCGAPRFKVPSCKNSTSHSRSKKTIVLVLGFVLPAIVILIVLIFVLVRCRKKSEIMIPAQTELLPITLRRIPYIEIVQSTDGFNYCNLLGKGSFGNVFKGFFSDGEIFAIKVFNLQLEGAFKSFEVECEILRNIRHRNLIKIITSCSNNHDFKALVLEYMPNGNLDKWLYSHNNYLNILQRLKVMIDVALALEYLHHGHATPIVHCDLKPSNILLDVDMVAHVGDFGISKLLGEGDFMKQTLTLATIGYMAPEYGTEGIVSTKGDVYSYGIMLMETFTRKKPTDEYFTNEMNLKRWVSDSLPDSVTEVADYNVLRSEDEHFIANKQCISSIFTLALNCCADSPEERIDMKEVVVRLVNIKKILPDLSILKKTSQLV